MLGFLIMLVKLLLAICIVATVHEFGHYIIAKLFKTQVNEFSIGFGPKIVQKKFKETMYSLRWLPLGGYVAIEGEDSESDSPNSFKNKNVFVKILILLAGATFNAILATIIFLSITSSYPTYTNKITKLSEDSVLQDIGIKEGDRIISINSKKVNVATDFSKAVYTNIDTTTIEYEREGNKYTVTTNEAVKGIGYIGVMFKQEGEEVTNIIDMVDVGRPAMNSDIKSGDKIIEVNGIETSNSSDVIEIIKENANKEVKIKILRNGEELIKTLTPDTKKIFNLGILGLEEVRTNIKYAWYSSYNNIESIVGSYIDLFRGKVKVSDMSGIVGIGEVVSKTSGFEEYINLVGILSLAIGVANIMPFPPLDGGKIVIVIGEAITRKKMSMKTEAIISYIGFALLLLLTVIVTYNDILRIF